MTATPTNEPRAAYGQWTMVSIKELVIPPDRIRKDFSKVPQLVESIRKVGLLHPLVVTLQPDGKYRLNAGESRMRACLLLGWSQVPVTFKSSLSEYEQKVIELEENLCRKDIEWSEEVEGLRQRDELGRKMEGSKLPGSTGEGWTMDKTALAVNQPSSTVKRKIKFAQLLVDRPDIKAKVKELPINVAMKRAEQIQESENVDRLSKSGGLVLSADIKLGSCLDLIKALAPGSVDLVYTDPPFGIPVLDEMEGKDRGSVQSYTSVLKPDDNATAKEVTLLLFQLAPELVRVMKPGAHLYMFFAFELYDTLKKTLELVGLVVNPVPLIWDKGLTTAPFRGYDYSPCYEPILFAHKPPRTRRLAEPCKSIIQFSPDRAQDKVHPFQKPLELARYFIKQSTLLGQRVLDPFCGSGSTVVAARSCGRTGLGFEKDPEHFNHAQARLLTETSDEIDQVAAKAQEEADRQE